ncbi:unnamed protein product [Cyclocybe aegerita]|uniref:F-box domain-containing protein n=1 Tax=Cyclocybe aegerita TaxID=1973307 RepID=A0A8S0XK13_CYCAE|nr:unnamed protein product [Cyclocybe aegerita]
MLQSVASAGAGEKGSHLGDPGLNHVELGLLNFPPEILLHILSYLDYPDLAVLAGLVPSLVPLTSDPVLHKYRLKIVSPSRVNHDLFGRSPAGHAFRPTIGDLVQRGVIRGLGIERRWRMGAYFYSLNSIKQYENGRSLSRRHASHILSVQLRRRTIPGSSASAALQTLYTSHVLPDVESSSPFIARSLLPVVRKLKWSLQRDSLARVFKDSARQVGVAGWLSSTKGEEEARRVFADNEKLRLAVCPGVSKRVGFYEKLGEASGSA